MDLVFGVRPMSGGGGGGSGTVTSVDTGAGLTGGPITTSGTISLDTIGSSLVMSNIELTLEPPVGNSLTDILDFVFTSTPGSILYRGATVWQDLAPGDLNDVLTYLGEGAIGWNPAGSGSNHDYAQALWVDDVGGNDSNTGLNINDPLFTYQAAVDLASTTPTVIYGINANPDNSETITIASGQAITISAFGTQFSGAFINSGILYLDCNAYTDFTENGASFINCLSCAGVTAINDTAAQYINTQNFAGSTTVNDGGFLNMFTVVNSGLVTVDSLGTANLSGAGPTIANAGTMILNLLSGTISSNTGQINGYINDLDTVAVNYGAVGFADVNDASVQYKMPVVAGSSGDVLTSLGGTDTAWQAPSGGGGNPTAVTLSPSVFTYFNCITTGAIIWLSSSAPNTQGAFVSGATNDYGTFTFKAAAGTYNLGITYTEGLGNGIMSIIVNGGTPQDLDQYGTNVNQYRSYQFTFTLVEGDNTIQIVTNGKNPSAGDYYLNFAGDLVFNRTGP